MNELIQQLEEGLLLPSTRKSAQAVADLLAEDFVEFGSSGRVFNRQQIIESLQQESGACRRSIHDFTTKILAPGIVLATYRIVRHSEQGDADRQLLRSSIWRLSDGRWQMVFHQGTLVVNPPAANSNATDESN